MYDLIIIGAGPAGIGAALYAVYHKLRVLVLAKEFGNFSDRAGTPNLVLYQDLLDKFHQELAKKENHLEFKEKQEVLSVDKNVVSFSAETTGGQIYYSKAMLLAYGAELEFGLENMTAKDLYGKIKINSRQETNIEGLFAAGRCSAGEVRDVFLSASEGARAAVSAALYLGKI